LSLRFKTVVETLYFEAKLDGDSRGATFLDDEGREERVPYIRMLEGAYLAASALQRAGVAKGDRVPIVVPTSSAFASTFFGLELVGAVPCPLPLPAGFGDLEGFAARVEWTARYLGARHVVTNEQLRSLIPGTPTLLVSELLRDPGGNPAFTAPTIEATDTAMIQCTSASTGQPKGVLLSHENLIANVHQIGFVLGVTEKDVVVTWLPLYHDMGLIGCLLFSIYWNLDAVLLSPARFLKRPVSWLEAIARHRGTLSPAPNFAYAYATSRIKEDELAGLDLSSFRVAMCGAEPVDPRTLERFEERFAKNGLRRSVSVPCYGLAEATLGVTFHPVGEPLAHDRVSREGLARGEVQDDPAGVFVASCGKAMPETRVRIVDDDGGELPAGRVGNVEVSGPSIMKGYHELPDETAAVLRGGWLATGDLGYLRDGALRITGRKKDIIIIRGRNYVPQDFEWAAEEVAGIRKGNAVAFGVPDDAQGTETLHLVCETDLEGETRDELARAVRVHVGARTGIAPAHVELVPRNTIPKTSSGKLQRRKTRERYLLARAFRIVTTSAPPPASPGEGEQLAPPPREAGERPGGGAHASS
jgi:acyl-CoA synthetase (AMP-forming)/AMP-acid ligase II